MASIFTYDPDPPRVSSPWSTSGPSTPQFAATASRAMTIRSRSRTDDGQSGPDYLSDYGISKLDPEPQEGPTEYKLHLLLRPRRQYTTISTGNAVGGSYHSRIGRSAHVPVSSSQEMSPKLMSPPLQSQPKSAQSRQQRLEQLTTQLLWRLQQSSPFHSSSAANPALPMLPDTSPNAGLSPQRPARLLPGLEESQGALYEIGVSDDGIFVGLTCDELEESLVNLQIMATSLGCKVEVLRRVVVGECQWNEEEPLPASQEAGSFKARTDCLWVAEALVSPDLDFYKSSNPRGEFARKESSDNQSRNDQEATVGGDQSDTEQIRVSITGPSTAGKSSLLGTLTTSSLDNGRGKSRLSLLKHRHEISSGVTSSVAQELIGYAPTVSPEEDIQVVNYSSGNAATWNDIHAASNGGRLAFVSDLPGLIRYSKSTLRGLVSWAPHYVLLCIPANGCDEEVTDNEKGSGEQMAGVDLCLAFLDLCIKLEVPTLVVITKMDIASRGGLKNTLSKVLSTLKTAGKRPIMLPVSEKVTDLQLIRAGDRNEVKKTVASVDDWLSTVPIILTSAVDGSGIGKLNAFLRYLPTRRRQSLRTISSHEQTTSLWEHLPDIFDVDEVFAIPPSSVYSSTEDTSKGNRGVVLCGLVRYGTISVGDKLVIGPVLDQRRESLASHPISKGRHASGELSNSYLQGSPSLKVSMPQTQARWQEVLVVSVRNLRLPVRSLKQDQVGTVGIEPIPQEEEDGYSQACLGRIRKGMVLCNFNDSSLSSPSPTTAACYTGFVASFACSQFSSSKSPPLLLGGNAIAYISNVRAPVKVICVTLAEDEVTSEAPPSPTEPEFFSFDSDPADQAGNDNGYNNNGHRASTNYNYDVSSEVSEVITNSSTSREEIRVTFSFISSVEWIELGSRVLLMPGVSMASSDERGSTMYFSGLEGFSGRVCDVLDGSGS